jgi:RNA polymerase sigma-70 factor (ECF subfamily)
VNDRPGDPPRTEELLLRIKGGDESARDVLIERYFPILQRWARGRLPAEARDLQATDDLIQISLLKALDRVEDFEPRREGAFLAYLRQIVLNAIRSEIRRAARKPARSSFEPIDLPAPAGPEPLGPDVLERYEAALAILPDRQREAVVLRVEFAYSFPEIAAAIGSRSPDAARMMVKRGILRIAQAMGDVRT